MKIVLCVATIKAQTDSNSIPDESIIDAIQDEINLGVNAVLENVRSKFTGIEFSKE